MLRKKEDELKHLSSLLEKSTEILLVMASERNLDGSISEKGIQLFIEGQNPVNLLFHL